MPDTGGLTEVQINATLNLTLNLTVNENWNRALNTYTEVLGNSTLRLVSPPTLQSDHSTELAVKQFQLITHLIERCILEVGYCPTDIIKKHFAHGFQLAAYLDQGERTHQALVVLADHKKMSQAHEFMLERRSTIGFGPQLEKFLINTTDRIRTEIRAYANAMMNSERNTSSENEDVFLSNAAVAYEALSTLRLNSSIFGEILRADSQDLISFIDRHKT
jgi:hypothetical protein